MALTWSILTEVQLFCIHTASLAAKRNPGLKDDLSLSAQVESEVKSLSRVRLFATSWTAAYQASPSMGFSMQEYWSGLSFPSPGDLPDPGIEPGSPALEADAST